MEVAGRVPDRARPAPRRAGPAGARAEGAGAEPPRQPERRRREGEPTRALRPRAADERNGPELEVLRHVLHDWASVEHWIHYEDLFESDLHAMAFRALMAHPTVPEAIEAADPGVAELLARLAAEEVDSDPFDAVVRLLTERARHEVTALVSRINAEPSLQRDSQWLTAGRRSPPRPGHRG